MASDMKIKILNDMLAKGYINEERYQKWKLDDHFSENDAAKYQYLFNAYANIDNGNQKNLLKMAQNKH